MPVAFLDRSATRDVREEQSLREDWLSDSLLSGFIATFAMSAALAVAYGVANVAGDQNGWFLERWLYNLNHNKITDRAGDSVITAIAVNLAVGLLFALVYGRIESRIPAKRGYQRGMLFALPIWLASILIVFPIMNGGVFGVNLHAGPLPVIGNLFLHLVYGAVLGALYAVDVDAWLDRNDDEHFTALDMQRDTMIGVLAGAVLGGIGGIFLEGSLDSVLAGGFTIVASVLVGGAIGALVGSFLTEDHHKSQKQG